MRVLQYVAVCPNTGKSQFKTQKPNKKAKKSDPQLQLHQIERQGFTGCYNLMEIAIPKIPK